jgi:hypothetical protein
VTVATLLDRLEKVRQTGAGRWVAPCPSHKDRSPSLSIRELDDGRVLLHDFGGCGAIDVLEALGLDWSALFPPQLQHVELPARASRIPARDLLEVISEEVMIAAFIAADLLANKAISEADWTRLSQAARRIGRARDHVHEA